jgi:adenylate cyclase class 2
MLEVEMKFPVADFRAVEQWLSVHDATEDPPREDADQYFNAPDRDFARTDEALRLRRIGAANLVTYKGPKRDPQTKTRTEIEVPLGSGDAVAEAFTRLLVSLGFRPVALVRKKRRVFHFQRDGFAVEACLDEVVGLGPFVEVEIIAPEDRLESARAVLLDLSAELGLTTSERRSYLELLLAKASKSVAG